MKYQNILVAYNILTLYTNWYFILRSRMRKENLSVAIGQQSSTQWDINAVCVFGQNLGQSGLKMTIDYLNWTKQGFINLLTIFPIRMQFVITPNIYTNNWYFRQKQKDLAILSSMKIMIILSYSQCLWMYHQVIHHGFYFDRLRGLFAKNIDLFILIKQTFGKIQKLLNSSSL